MSSGALLADARGGDQQKRRLLHLSLRSRITLSFALGVLVLSSALAAITYFTARSQIVSQELAVVQRQAYVNAELLYNQVSSTPVPRLQPNLDSPVLSALEQIDQESAVSSGQGSGSAPNSQPVSLFYSTVSGEWIQPNPLGSVPSRLGAQVIRSNNAAYEVDAPHGTPQVAVGIPVPGLGGYFFEVFSLEQTSRTLRIILAALSVAGLVTTVAGAVLGRWAAGRAVRPLQEVSQAALAIASGRLGTRLEAGDTPDLAVLASSFNRMVDRLQQRIERDARFTSDVSHELRSPLTTLAASLSVIEARRDELPERSRQALDLVAVEVRRFQQMVGELLEISRLDAGSADFEASVVPVGELVRRSVAATSGDGRIPVEIDPAVEDRKLVVDKRRFERIVGNLLENAARYAGGATRVLVEDRETTVRVIVEDKGPGIPASERDRVFERFARGSVAAGSRGAGGGTGLGLALVLEHVKLHGGRVWVEGRIGGGSRFVVELPLASREAVEDEEAAAERAAGAISADEEPASTGEVDGGGEVASDAEAAGGGPPPGDGLDGSVAPTTDDASVPAPAGEHR